jgi:hypothetical protein
MMRRLKTGMNSHGRIIITNAWKNADSDCGSATRPCQIQNSFRIIPGWKPTSFRLMPITTYDLCGRNVMARKSWTAKIQRLILSLLLAMFFLSAPLVVAADDSAFDCVTTTNAGTLDNSLSWRVAEMTCCHCYKRMPGGTRFYFGVREVESCHSYPGGHCVGYTKCFP